MWGGEGAYIYYLPWLSLPITASSPWWIPLPLWWERRRLTLSTIPKPFSMTSPKLYFQKCANSATEIFQQKSSSYLVYKLFQVWLRLALLRMFSCAVSLPFDVQHCYVCIAIVYVISTLYSNPT